MKKILYFVDGLAPTPEDVKKAGKIEGVVLYRNTQTFDPSDFLEACDAVAGNPPQAYIDKYDFVNPGVKKKAVEKGED